MLERHFLINTLLVNVHVIYFFKQTQEAEICPEGHTMPRSMHRAYLNKLGNGRHVYVRAWPRPSRSAWA